MPKLSPNQLQEYNDNGYVAPIDVLTKNETIEIRKEIEFIEQKFPKEIERSGRYNVQIARGNNEFGYNKVIKRSSGLLNENDIKLKNIENENLQKIFYNGSKKKGQY